MAKRLRVLQHLVKALQRRNCGYITVLKRHLWARGGFGMYELGCAKSHGHKAL